MLENEKTTHSLRRFNVSQRKRHTERGGGISPHLWSWSHDDLWNKKSDHYIIHMKI